MCQWAEHNIFMIRNNSNETNIISDKIKEKLKNTSDFAIPPVSVSYVEKQLQILEESP